jgi:hypothetical protein
MFRASSVPIIRSYQLYTWQFVCFMQVMWPLLRRVSLELQNFILSRNSTCFGHLLCPSSGVISCTRGNWYVSCRLCGRCLGQSRWNQSDFPRPRPHNLHETFQLPGVQLITPDDGHRRCPKHAEFRDKIKFWILDASCWLFIRRLSRCTVTWTWSAAVQFNWPILFYFVQWAHTSW